MGEDGYERNEDLEADRSSDGALQLVLREDAGPVADGLMAPAALDGEAYHGVTVICAEPGMGKTHIARKLVQAAKRMGRDVCQYVCDDASSNCISHRIVRRTRDVRMRREQLDRPLVVFDGVAPGDEAETLREAHAIERLAEDDVQVVVCLRPESEQLAEQLPEATCLGAEQLLFRSYDGSESALDHTGGIPALVVAQRTDVALGDNREELGYRYLDALAKLVGNALREGLTAEESAIRLAMILLGHGSMDDVAMVAGRCDEEQFQWLHRDAPLFGIDLHEMTFGCHGLKSDQVLERCLDALQGAAAAMPSVVVRACGALAARGDTRRSAAVCRLCSTERDFARACTDWGVPYVVLGEAEMVREGLRVARSLGQQKGLHEALSNVAVQSVLGNSRELDIAAERLEGLRLTTTGESRDLRTAQILVACREVLRNPKEASKYLSAPADELKDLALLDHLRVTRLLTQGRFGEAYSMVSNDMLLRAPESMGGAMVCDDLVIALSLYGGSLDHKERTMMRRADEVFERSGMASLRVYHEALLSMPDILMSDSTDTSLLEVAIKRAERMGDTYFQGVCLLVTAVADVRAHALARAHVRANRAALIARELEEAYLANAAELVDALSLELLGDVGVLSAYCGAQDRPGDFVLFGRIASVVAGTNPRGFLVEVPAGTPCPRDYFWVLNMLSDCDVGARDRLSALIPPTWQEQIRASRVRDRTSRGRTGGAWRDAARRTHRAKPEPLEQGAQTEMIPPEHGLQTVRVSIFGNFSVECLGTKLPDAAFDRRRSRELLMLLAVASGHRVRRFQAIDILWPREDYYAGPRRLYEATAEARKRLREACAGVNPILADRLQGTLGFDMTLVSCDVDEFEREATLTLREHGDDFWVLEHAQNVERVYASGPDLHVSSMGQLVNDRLSELRVLYVDCAVTAAEAALRLGKAKLAVRYGFNAHREDSLREDAMIALVRALKAAGRGYEVPELYKRYARRLLEAEGVPPSTTLRRVVEEAMEKGPDDLP